MKSKDQKKTVKPTRKDAGRYERWVKYLIGTKITKEQIHDRSTQLTKAKRDPE